MYASYNNTYAQTDGYDNLPLTFAIFLLHIKKSPDTWVPGDHYSTIFVVDVFTKYITICPIPRTEYNTYDNASSLMTA
ncbi:MAG: hypothetical protein BGO09_13645 [Bacteroidetes bacterium 47-18]|nr:MAG: hypothetical protein BGO09_13645 [Bacteroidetes bacterium 47-18]